MKTGFLIVLLLLNTLLLKVYGQDSIKTISNFETTVKRMSNSGITTRGYLYHVTDTSLLISPFELKKGFSESKLYLKEIYCLDIKTIKIQRKNSAIRGLGYGALAGLAVGIVSGLASGNYQSGSIFHFTPGQKALLGGVVCAPAGGAIGILIGLGAVEISIDGIFENFNKSKYKLRPYSYKK